MGSSSRVWCIYALHLRFMQKIPMGGCILFLLPTILLFWITQVIVKYFNNVTESPFHINSKQGLLSIIIATGYPFR